MKKLLVLLLVVVFAMAMVVGCAKPAPVVEEPVVEEPAEEVVVEEPVVEEAMYADGVYFAQEDGYSHTVVGDTLLS